MKERLAVQSEDMTAKCRLNITPQGCDGGAQPVRELSARDDRRCTSGSSRRNGNSSASRDHCPCSWDASDRQWTAEKHGTAERDAASRPRFKRLPRQSHRLSRSTDHDGRSRSTPETYAQGNSYYSRGFCEWRAGEVFHRGSLRKVSCRRVRDVRPVLSR